MQIIGVKLLLFHVMQPYLACELSSQDYKQQHVMCVNTAYSCCALMMSVWSFLFLLIVQMQRVHGQHHCDF